jgi:hypothetical protein
MLTAIEKITRRANKIASGKDSKIEPGLAIRLSEAASVNDCVRQGDLYLIVVESIPASHKRVAKPKAIDCQLVPGNTEGAKHCLDSLAGVELYRPAAWGPNYDELDGPVFKLSQDRTVQHPTHGDVTIPAGFTITCRYQREWDAEQARERRNAD